MARLGVALAKLDWDHYKKVARSRPRTYVAGRTKGDLCRTPLELGKTYIWFVSVLPARNAPEPGLKGRLREIKSP